MKFKLLVAVASVALLLVGATSALGTASHHHRGDVGGVRAHELPHPANPPGMKSIPANKMHGLPCVDEPFQAGCRRSYPGRAVFGTAHTKRVACNPDSCRDSGGCFDSATELTASSNTAEQGAGNSNCPNSSAFYSWLILWEQAKAGNWVAEASSRVDWLPHSGRIYNTTYRVCGSLNGRRWAGVQHSDQVGSGCPSTCGYVPGDAVLEHWGCEAPG